MSRTLTASDVTSLIRLASTMGRGSEGRKVILYSVTTALATSKVASRHDGKNVHVFGYNQMPKTLSIAKKMGGRVTETGVDFDSEGDPQDWADIVFRSKDDAIAFAKAVDWDRADARMHYKDVKVLGIGSSKW